MRNVRSGRTQEDSNILVVSLVAIRIVVKGFVIVNSVVVVVVISYPVFGANIRTPATSCIPTYSVITTIFGSGVNFTVE